MENTNKWHLCILCRHSGIHAGIRILPLFSSSKPRLDRLQVPVFEIDVKHAKSPASMEHRDKADGQSLYIWVDRLNSFLSSCLSVRSLAVSRNTAFVPFQSLIQSPRWSLTRSKPLLPWRQPLRLSPLFHCRFVLLRRRQRISAVCQTTTTSSRVFSLWHVCSPRLDANGSQKAHHGSSTT